MKSHINLLPVSYCQRALLRTRAAQWGVAVALAVACVLATHFVLAQKHHSLENRLEALHGEYDPVKKILKQNTQMRAELERLDENEVVTQELESQRYLLTLIDIVSRSAEACGGKLHVTELEVSDLQGEATSRLQRPGGGDLAARSLRVSGLSLDNVAVTQMVDGLRNAGVFRDVELLSMGETTQRDVTLLGYTVRCTF